MARSTTATKSAPAAEKEAPEVRGTTWLAEHVNSETGSNFDGYAIRILLRKLTKDGVIERGEGRYNFGGPRDKTVLAVVKAVKSGEADKAKSERLEGLKAKKAAAAPAKKAAPATKPARTRTRKAAAKPEPEATDDEELDIDDI